MKALITGASSGIGKDMAYYLSSIGYDLILVARRRSVLEKIKKDLNQKVTTIALDLANEKNVYKLYEMVKNENIDMLINNAGFGLLGAFYQTSIIEELEMVNLNIKTPHILTKLFLKKFLQNDKGIILNVASTAAFYSGPNMSTYYATKNYLLRLSLAIYEELKEMKSNVQISVLCPGPTDTEFNERAKAKFMIKSLSSSYVAKYAIDKAIKKELIIIPGLLNKLTVLSSKFLPETIKLKIVSRIQKKKY